MEHNKVIKLLLKNIPVLVLRMWEYWQAEAYWDINPISPVWLVIVYTDAMTLVYWEEEVQLDG